MKKLLSLLLLTLATTSYANSSNQKTPPGQSNSSASNVEQDATSTLPPGLSNKDTPSGLSKQNKAVSGWNKGKKAGWNKSSI